MIREGSHHRGPMANSCSTLPMLDGLGERVEALSPEGEVELVLGSTYRGGIVESAEATAGEIVLNLWHPITELDREGHRLVAWDPALGIRFATAGELVCSKDGRQIRWALPDTLAPACAGLAFRGTVVGWAPLTGVPDLLSKLSQGVLAGEGPLDTRGLAAMAAAFPLPVLHTLLGEEPGPGAGQMAQAASARGSQFLLGWRLGAVDRIGGLAAESTGPAARRWLDVTGSLLALWDPSLEGTVALDALMQCFFPGNSGLLDPSIWIRMACWNLRAFAFLLDSLPNTGTPRARQSWRTELTACLAGRGEDEGEIAEAIRAWSTDMALRPMAAFIRYRN